MWKKTFIGYDLGDGETITDLITIAEPDAYGATKLTGAIQLMTMPDSNTPATAIPTAFGFDKDGRVVFASSILADMEDIHNICNNFKRCPTDLITKASDARLQDMLRLFSDGKWPTQKECPEVYTEKMMAFSESVITFTNAIFEYPEYKSYIRSASVDSEEITFCVGHPTRWSKLDVSIYKAILCKSVLGKGSYAGKPSSVVLGAESRAAFLYCKDFADSSVLPKDTCALLIDIGSSTIDVTAMTADSRNYQYNSGNNYLGARGIDFLIREWYLNQLQRDKDDWEVYQEIVTLNPSFELGVTLACRMAKEKVYSVKAGKAKIDVGDFDTVKIDMETIDNLVSSSPIAPILKKYIELPESQVSIMGNKTWKTLFREFISNCHSEMTAQNIRVGRIILTGSASKMPFVPSIVAEVFSELNENGILKDMNPARSISMGLSLVGPFNEKSMAFQKDVIKLIETDIPKVIEDDLPALVSAISGPIERVVTKKIKDRMVSWRNGNIPTLKQMCTLIGNDCSATNLTTALDNDTEYKKAINTWVSSQVSVDIAQKLSGLCKKYGVTNFALDTLNIIPSDINISTGGDIDVVGDTADSIAAIIAIIAGIISATMITTIAAAITVLVASISTELAVLLFDALVAMGPVGWGILAVVVGATVTVLIAQGFDAFKSSFNRMVQTADLPIFARKLLTDNKISKEIKKANIADTVKKSINDNKTKQKIVTTVSNALRSQIEKKAEDIRYVIESK